MPGLYPFLVVPEFHERVWGTKDLRPYFTRVVEGDPIGEVWLTGDQCRISGGPLAGRTLGELAAEFGADFTGTAAPQPNRFPLLIKFLYPKQKLSVQVHPTDEDAHAVGEPCGKTECWYVARALPGAQVGLGLRTGINREMFRMAIESHQAEHMLNWLDVKAGEMLYVDAGTVHAIGANAIIVETQQNSDVTYRLYDYGRPRELHLEKGLAAIREKTHAGRVLPSHEASAQVLVALDGGAVVECEGAATLTVMRGDTVIIPASARGVSLRPQWAAELLRMSLPAVEPPEPETEMPTTGAGHSH
jgi:mannose-6-phosphate isomerase